MTPSRRGGNAAHNQLGQRGARRPYVNHPGRHHAPAAHPSRQTSGPRWWKSQLSQLRSGRHHNYRLQAAWNAHGEAAFRFAVVEHVAGVADLVAAEQRQLNAALAAGPVYNWRWMSARQLEGSSTRPRRLKTSAAIKASMTRERIAAMRERVSGARIPAPSSAMLW
jgi:hypothetical protein